MTCPICGNYHYEELIQLLQDGLYFMYKDLKQTRTREHVIKQVENELNSC